MLDQAQQCFEKAQSFKDGRDFESARNWLEKAVELEPDFFDALINLSEACRILNDDAAAIKHLSHALKLKPGFFSGHNVLGVLLQKNGDCKGAAIAFNRAIECNPEFADAYYNLGNCLRDVEEFDGAIECFRAAFRLKPSFIEALSNLGEALQVTGRIREAAQSFKSALDIDPACTLAFSNYLLTLNYDPQFGPRDLYGQHKKFGALFPDQDNAAGFTNNCVPARRLRIGYVSADFRSHPVSWFIRPVLAHHYATDFDVFCYGGVKTPDSTTDMFKGLSGHWTDIAAMPDKDVSDKIRADGIDILVDLSGHSAENRLPVFASRAAPLQVTYLGYPNTTGLKTMDYRITDHVADPLCEISAHTERLVRISPCFCCYSPPHDAPEPGPLPARQNKAVTFGSTHTLARLNGDLLDLWASLLATVPTSRLLIMRTTLKGSSLDRIYSRFESHAIPRNRLIIQNAVPPDGHLAVYRDMDILLDSFPWSGHTSACEALWMGVPVVTLLGNRHAGRMVASVLSCIGMKAHIARTPEQYVSVARDLASDIDKLDNIRATLRDRMAKSPLCDGTAFTAKLEVAFRTVWREYCGK